jgi:hypothetical protein
VPKSVIFARKNVESMTKSLARNVQKPAVVVQKNAGKWLARTLKLNLKLRKAQ